MFSKQNFSNNITSLEENLQSKMLNTNIYTKSYVRTTDSFYQRTGLITDNNHILSSSLKKKVNKWKRLNGHRNISKRKVKSLSKARKLPKKVPIEFIEGRALATQTFLYKNRKNDGFRFHSSILKLSSCTNHIEALGQAIKGLSKSNNTWNKSSLLVLFPKRGGFTCYASGMLGYLPKKHARILFYRTISFLLKDKKPQTRLKNVLFVTDKQNSSVSFFLLRLGCVLGKVRFVFRKERKRFSLSCKRKGKRRRRNRKSAYRRYKMIFLSGFKSQ